MREKELRIALVCFGGVSLAVYMHGISKEILKLVRASATLHAITDRTIRAGSRFGDAAAGGRGYDTESVYYELLRDIGAKIDLRVIVDIIAGASAGGINGTLLARALAHDLPLDPLRDLWLRNADVTELLAPEARARTIWSKGFLHPVIMGLAAAGMLEEVRESEARQKLSLFVRSRWFKPPFDGRRMSLFMYDAVTAMGEPARQGASLLPAGHELELFVTVTDHYGYQHLVECHDPPLLREREHRHTLRFAYRQRQNGEIESDFGLADAPALAFAARATSSFPGAFPPAQIAEMERVLKERGLSWPEPERDRFIGRNFEPYAQAGADPRDACFVDGSVLNNKPFRTALLAVKGRPAYRQVDRRLVYVDPDPERLIPRRPGHIPGFFSTLRAALSDIPRNEPIASELLWVNGFNERVRNLNAIIAAVRPRITQLVDEIIAIAPNQPLTAGTVRAWRDQVNAEAAKDCGFAYEGYLCLRLASVRLVIARLVATILGVQPGSAAFHRIAGVADAWARHAGFAYDQEMLAEGAAVPAGLQFLRRFDIDFSRRRLYFLIQGQNRLYQMLDDQGIRGTGVQIIDRMKREFYQCLDTLDLRDTAGFYAGEIHDAAQALFGPLRDEEAETSDPSPSQPAPRQFDPERFAKANAAALDELVAQMGRKIDLEACTEAVDALLGGTDPSVWPPGARKEVIVNYLGFPYWDALTLSVANWRNAGEFDEIRVDRISPEDARTLHGLGIEGGPKGTGLGHFAAFFSRAYREHDYLLGRLHGVDRLIDIVCDSGGIDPSDERILAMKRRAFALILEVEEAFLPRAADLIRALRRTL